MSGSTRLGDDYLEMTLLLKRGEGGFGFRVVGGEEERSQVHFINFYTQALVHVSFHHIVCGYDHVLCSVAASAGCNCKGLWLYIYIIEADDRVYDWR